MFDNMSNSLRRYRLQGYRRANEALRFPFVFETEVAVERPSCREA